MNEGSPLHNAADAAPHPAPVADWGGCLPWQGDLKGYLRSCRGADSMTPDPLTLQRMACEVACGILHLHKNNYVHR